MTGPDTPPTGVSARRRQIVGAGVALVVVVLLAVGTLLAGAWSGDPADAAPAATSASARPSATDEAADPTGPAPATPDAPAVTTGNPDELPPSLPAVPLDAEAAVGNGITASLLSVQGVNGTASGPGNIAGPAIRVTVRLTNGTSAPVDAALVSVDLTHGNDRSPASPLDDPARLPFSGTLEPGATVEGTYVFSVPADDRGVVTVSVGYQAGAPFMVFTGSAT